MALQFRFLSILIGHLFYFIVGGEAGIDFWGYEIACSRLLRYAFGRFGGNYDAIFLCAWGAWDETTLAYTVGDEACGVWCGLFDWDE